MAIARFPTLTDGHPPGREYPQQIVPLGALNVPSGRLLITSAGDYPVGGIIVVVPPGAHQVKLTLAEVMGREGYNILCPAYLSVVLDDSETVRADFLSAREAPGWTPEAPSQLETPYRMGVLDAEVVKNIPWDVVYEDVPGFEDYSKYANVMDPETLKQLRCTNFVLPGATQGENTIECDALRSRNRCHPGDRNMRSQSFPVIGTFNAQSRLTGVHVDFEFEDYLPEFDAWRPDPALVGPPKKRGFFKRLFRMP